MSSLRNTQKMKRVKWSLMKIHQPLKTLVFIDIRPPLPQTTIIISIIMNWKLIALGKVLLMQSIYGRQKKLANLPKTNACYFQSERGCSDLRSTHTCTPAAAAANSHSQIWAATTGAVLPGLPRFQSPIFTKWSHTEEKGRDGGNPCPKVITQRRTLKTNAGPSSKSSACLQGATIPCQNRLCQ